MNGKPSGHVEACGRDGFRAIIVNPRTGAVVAARDFHPPGGGERAGDRERTRAHHAAAEWLQRKSDRWGYTVNACRLHPDNDDAVEMSVRDPHTDTEYWCVVDTRDLSRLRAHEWRAEMLPATTHGDGTGYARYAVTDRSGHGRHRRSDAALTMHEYLGVGDARHANGDSLDNRRVNLVSERHRRRPRSPRRPTSFIRRHRVLRGSMPRREVGVRKTRRIVRYS